MTTPIRSIALALAAGAALAAAPTVDARPGGPQALHGGWHGGAHWSGPAWHGGYRHPGYRYRGYWGPGVFWGGLGLGLGIGAIGYAATYGTYYDGYYPYPVAYPGYVVVDPVAEAPVVRSSAQPVPQTRAPDPIFYPRNGQNAAALESDRQQCNRWAATQAGALADASIFQRATLACMDGRGYTVR